PGILADAGDRDRLGVLVEVDGAAGDRHRCHVGVEQFGERHPLVVRTDRHRGDVLEVEVLALLGAINAYAGQLLLHAAAAEVVHARAVGGELWHAAVAVEAARLAAVDRLQPQAGVEGEAVVDQAARALLAVGDVAAVRREHRVEVETGLAGDDALAAIAEVAHDDAALAFVAVAHEHQLPAIAAEGGRVVEGIAAA